MKKKIIGKTEKKSRPKKKTKSSRAVNKGEEKKEISKMRRDSTFKEKDATPLKPVLPSMPFIRTIRGPGLKYSMTLTEVNNIFDIDEQENEDQR